MRERDGATNGFRGSSDRKTTRSLARSLLALSDLEKIICFERRTITGHSHRVAVGRDVKVLCSVDSGESSEEDSKKTGARIADVQTYIQGSAKRWALGFEIPASWFPLAARGGASSRNLGPISVQFFPNYTYDQSLPLNFFRVKFC